MKTYLLLIETFHILGNLVRSRGSQNRVGAESGASIRTKSLESHDIILLWLFQGPLVAHQHSADAHRWSRSVDDWENQRILVRPPFIPLIAANWSNQVRRKFAHAQTCFSFPSVISSSWDYLGSYFRYKKPIQLSGKYRRRDRAVATIKTWTAPAIDLPNRYVFAVAGLIFLRLLHVCPVSYNVNFI